MFLLIKQLFSLLDKSIKKKLIILQFLNLLQACFEVLTLGLIAIYISIINDNQIIKNFKYFENYYNLYFNGNINELIFYFSFILIFFVFLSFFLAIYINSKMLRFAHLINVFISNRLFNYYLNKSWAFHVNHDFSDTVRVISHDASIIGSKLIIPLLNLSHKIVIVTSISLIVAFYNLNVALISFAVFSLIYFFIIKKVKKTLKKYTELESNIFKKRNSTIINTFQGIKEIILYDFKNYFSQQFKNISYQHIKPAVKLGLVIQIPRLVVECIAYIVIIFSIFIALLLNYGMESILPTFAIYAFAGLKLLPSFQQIYMSLVSIKNGKIHFNTHKVKILKDYKFKTQKIKHNSKIFFKKEIVLKKIKFAYHQNSKSNTLDIENLKIKKNSIVGIAGLTGSGKSTLVDLIMNLIDQKYGKIYIDGKSLKANDKKIWMNNFAFVSQNPHFFNSTVLYNLTFGLKKEDVDLNKVNEVIKLANLKKKIDSMEMGIDTVIGDRGLKLSGGERQRLAIARALYHDKDIIVFDEATSSVDSLTEKNIIDSIKKLKRKKTIIIIAHRVKTLKICEQIHLIKDGKIVANGSYNNLIKKSNYFKHLNG